jgi:hypothetical protein
MLPRFNAQPELVGLIDQNTSAEYEDRIEQVTQFEADTRWFSVTDNMAPHEQVPLTAWSGEESIDTQKMYLTSSDLELTIDTADDQIVGIVFPSIDVPQGARVSNAHVLFEIDEARPGQSDTPVSIRIYGELAINAVVPSITPGDLTNRTATITYVDWQPEATVAVGDDLSTVNIGTIVTEIVGQGHWIAGNSLCILFARISGQGVRWVETASPQGITNNGIMTPALHITWRKVSRQMSRLPPQQDLTKTNHLQLRHIRVENNEAFGGGGLGHGAVISLTASTCQADYVEFVGNVQNSVGAGVIFAAGSNISTSFSLFKENRNIGMGAGVIFAIANSQVVTSYSIFRQNYIANLRGATAYTSRASCIAVEQSAISTTHSTFEVNAGGDVVVARAASTVDMSHTTFRDNTWAVFVCEDGSVHQQKFDTQLCRMITSNTGRGATISLWEGSIASLLSCSFVKNEGYTAGAVFVTDSNTAATFDGASFFVNQAVAPDAAGGAIFATDHAIVHVSRSIINSNSAFSQLAAGAIYASNSADITLIDTTLSANQADAHATAGSVFGSGAVYTDGSVAKLIQTTVVNNTAAGGTGITRANYADGLYILFPLMIYVEDGTYEPLVWGGKTSENLPTVSINPRIINPGEIVQGSCQQHPCAPGNSCAYAKFSITCQPCPQNTYSSEGIRCEICEPGFGSSVDRTSCLPCGGPSDPLAYSPFGICLECHDENVVNLARTICGPQGSSVARDGL